MKHCYGCKIEKEEYLEKLAKSGELYNILAIKKNPFRGNYCYHCILIRKQKREQLNYGKRPLETIDCPSCSVSFKQKVSRQKCCSRECLYKHRWQLKKNNKVIITKNCSICSKEFSGRRSYCSAKCYYVFIRPKKKGPKIITSCVVCFKRHDNERFCSRTCKSVYAALHPKVKKSTHKKIRIVNCKYCTYDFETISHARLYCSKKCIKKSQKFHKKQYDKIRELKKKQRVPTWANYRKIEEFYSQRPEGFHVDHIIPLNGKNVCGLHVEYNLQYLTPEDNTKKGNQNDGSYENLSWKI